MIRLQPPVKSRETLVALAASGSTGFARKAQAELKRRTNAGLAKAVANV